MKTKKNFGGLHRLSIRSKLFWSYFLTMLLTISLAGWIMSSVIRNAIETSIESELSNSTTTILNLVESTTNASIKNLLRAVAEKNLDIVRDFHRRYKKGELSEKAAKKQARQVLLSQTIGSTGYIYCLDSRGTIKVHPNKALIGENISQYTFVKDQMQQKEGYITYEWTSPGEEIPKNKALYMVHFTPWDWIISVSSYREEFIQLIKTRDFEQSVNDLRFGITGYAYIVDGKGNFLVHPTLQGTNIKAPENIDGKEFVQEMIRKKNGRIIYRWQNPGEKHPREKLVIYNHIPELDWIVASSSYLDEFYSPLATINYTIFSVAFVILILAFLITFYLGKSIITPLYQLISHFKVDSQGDFSRRMTIDSGGEIGELAGCYNNFMERLEGYHRKLQISEENFRGIFEGAVEGIFKSTADGDIVTLNSSLALMLGYETPEALMAATNNRVDPLFVEKKSAVHLMSVLKNKGHLTFYEARLYKKDRSIIWVSLSIRGIWEQGVLTFVEGFVNDISDQKRFRKELIKRQTEIEEKNIILEGQTAELRRLSAIKDDFLAMTTHELRTPLHGMIGIADSLINDSKNPLSPGIKSDLEIIVSSGMRLSNLVNDLLVASKLKQKEIKLHLRPLDLGKTVNLVMGIHRPLLQNAHLTLENLIPDNTFVMADEERLQQILHNLIGNAVKFSDGGKIVVSTKIGSRVEIHVSDTGIGIEKEKIETIFLPFEQGDYSATRQYPGTGLGLSIARQLVVLHGGELHVKSEPDRGSVFTFTLTPSPEPPVRERQPVAKIVEVGPMPVDLPALENKAKSVHEIVVVDDDPVNLHIVSRQLTMSGYRAMTFTTGSTAVDYILNNNPCMVLLDLMMPGMDGFRVCEILRERHGMDELPIILLTARNQVTDLLQGFAKGANDYLTKPFSKKELIARVETQLRLLAAKDRLVNLRRFMNRIASYVDTDHLFKEVFNTITGESPFQHAVLLSNEKIMATAGNGDSFDRSFPAPVPSMGESEMKKRDSKISVINDNDTQWISIQARGMERYRIIVQPDTPPTRENMEYIRNLITQVRIIRNGITRFAFDPNLSKEIYTIGSMLQKILYIQAARQYCIVHTENKKVELRLSLKEITLRFNDEQLLQVHRSYLVNPTHVVSIKLSKKKGMEICLLRGRVPVGGSYKSTILDAFPGRVPLPD
ncbi:two component transcriptional regulator, LytTR family [Desulfocicer vacuolatum DSM 3385]|uniref:histidine kinase n=1 Tax=Desulfocicer vacuolatum DSM 3385 TaxID=1121400 RepID=A0A1W2E9J3_9BACT|nr:cache domain-containing protein [Desulfocicer vacuolatum]SMD06450.1 two component transcriptional regulator, LytTR family [Desulfocicer vacuolatum DSM 3385]